MQLEAATNAHALQHGVPLPAKHADAGAAAAAALPADAASAACPKGAAPGGAATGCAAGGGVDGGSARQRWQAGIRMQLSYAELKLLVQQIRLHRCHRCRCILADASRRAAAQPRRQPALLDGSGQVRRSLSRGQGVVPLLRRPS